MQHKNNKNSFPFKLVIGGLCAVIAIGGGGFAFARHHHHHIVPGTDIPYNSAAYYSPTTIDYADSPSTYALRDLAANGGSVIDYTRLAKSILDKIGLGNIYDGTVGLLTAQSIDNAPLSDISQERMAEILKATRMNYALNKTDPHFDTYNPHINSDDYDEDGTFLGNSTKPAGDAFAWDADQVKNLAVAAQTSSRNLQNYVDGADEMEQIMASANGSTSAAQAANGMSGLLNQAMQERTEAMRRFITMRTIANMKEHDEEERMNGTPMSLGVFDPDHNPYKIYGQMKGTYQEERNTAMPDFH